MFLISIGFFIFGSKTSLVQISKKYIRFMKKNQLWLKALKSENGTEKSKIIYI